MGLPAASEPQVEGRQLSRSLAAVAAVVVNPQGEVVTDPEVIAEVQRHHWADVFKKRHTSSRKRRQKLDEEKARGPLSLHALIANRNEADWEIRLKDVARAIKLSGKSAPGPDGIPFLAYRRLGVFAQNVIFQAITQLSQPGSENVMREVFTTEQDVCSFNSSHCVASQEILVHA